MPKEEGRSGFWWALLFAIVVTGIFSRLIETGFRLFDKYLGDALYAAMVYVLIRLSGRVTRVALWAAVAMLVIELFQLTGIAAAMSRSGSTLVGICSRLLGTDFSVLDLLAYAVGIGCMTAIDRYASSVLRGSRNGRARIMPVSNVGQRPDC